MLAWCDDRGPLPGPHAMRIAKTVCFDVTCDSTLWACCDHLGLLAGLARAQNSDVFAGLPATDLLDGQCSSAGHLL